MCNLKRRKACLAAVSLILIRTAADAANQPGTMPAEGKPDALFAAAVEFLRRRYVQQDRLIVHGPVSRLQREFLLGYAMACDLALELQRCKLWAVAEGPHGRSATIDPSRLTMYGASPSQ